MKLNLKPRKRNLFAKRTRLPLHLEKNLYEKLKQKLVIPFEFRADKIKTLFKDDIVLQGLETYTQPIVLNESEINAIVFEAVTATEAHTLNEVYASISSAIGSQVAQVNPQDVRENIRNIVQKSVREIKNLNDTTYNQLYNKVADLYFTQPKDYREQIFEAIQKATNLSDARVKTLAVTTINQTRASITKSHLQELGIEEYQWVSKRDNRVRKEHKEADGKIYSWDKPPSVTGGKHPGEAIRCRCIALPLLVKGTN